MTLKKARSVMISTMQQERARIAAAFGVKRVKHSWKPLCYPSLEQVWRAKRNHFSIEWRAGREELLLHNKEDVFTINSLGDMYSERLPPPQLAFEILERLGYDTSPYGTLSAHEKLELRLSLPREFWPKTWLQEEDR